jgi:hypothetical protein
MADSELSATFYSETSWIIRWLVVDTGNWLSERNSFYPLRLGATDAGRRQFPVKLTMQQVEDSPDVDTDPPVSRQSESHVYNHTPGTPMG